MAQNKHRVKLDLNLLTPGQKETFQSIASYDKDSAYRYYKLVTSPDYGIITNTESKKQNYGIQSNHDRQNPKSTTNHMVRYAPVLFPAPYWN